ncbi:MAG: 3',5'-cyclic-nucleotide phosphodiesterase [Planctomycetota bacterium]
MRFQVLGCSGGSIPGRRPTSFLLNSTVAIDGGALTSALSPDAQELVDHVVLSHAHLDHCANLPFLLDNRFARQTRPITFYGSKETIDDLRDCIFNNRIWPDFTTLRNRKSVALTLETIVPGVPFEINGLRFTPYEMEHTVPCLGYLIEDDNSKIFVSGDTGSAHSVRRMVEQVEGLSAVVIEISWPNRLDALARASGHLIPSHLEQAWPLHPEARILITHIKPLHYEEIVSELTGLGCANLVILEDGMEFEFRG